MTTLTVCLWAYFPIFCFLLPTDAHLYGGLSAGRNICASLLGALTACLILFCLIASFRTLAGLPL